MCSCKTKKFAHENNFVSKENTGTNYTKYQALADTSNVLKIDIDKSKLTITEHITITKYDKDTGAVTEKTETERKIAQDSNKVFSEEEAKGVSVELKDSLNYSDDLFEMVESESETVTESNGLKAPTIFLGLTIGLLIGLFIVYLLDKLRVN